MLPALQKLCHKWHEQNAKLKNGKSVRDKPEAVWQAIQAYRIEDDEVANPMTLEARIERERDVTGCFLSISPFEPYTQVINEWTTCTPADIKSGEVYGKLVFPAILTRYKEVVVKNGRTRGRTMAHMNWVGIEGDIEAPAFPDSYDEIRQKPGGLERNKVYMVMVHPDGKKPGKVIMQNVMRCARAVRQHPPDAQLHPPRNELKMEVR